MDPDLVARLVAPEGQMLLTRIGTYDDGSALSLATRLRAEGHDPDLVSGALAQARLRTRAAAKFGVLSTELLLTEDGLEQATRPELAARHARRFVDAGVPAVADLGCGLGLDARAFADAGLGVLAVERDELTAAFARANLAGYEGVSVITGDAAAIDLPPEAGVWVDPARRAAGPRRIDGRARRVWSLRDISPPWDQVQAWADGAPAAGAKLGPGFPHSAVPEGCEAQWTSWQGEVLECVVWWGDCVATPGRTAAVCRPGVALAVVRQVDLTDAPPLTRLDEVTGWLWEADRAVVRAGLSGALPGRELSPGVGYSIAGATGPGWARRWGVIEAMPLRVKAIRSWLRARDIGQVTVKKRGVAADPDRLRRELSGSGANSATLLVTTVAGTPAAIVLER